MNIQTFVKKFWSLVVFDSIFKRIFLGIPYLINEQLSNRKSTIKLSN
jgi:hypothetical protein